MQSERPIQLLAGRQLSDSLSIALSRNFDGRVSALACAADAVSDAILVTVTSECSTDECAGLASEGRAVVVLAALPSGFQERAYLEAGAAGYLPMTIDTHPLVKLIRSIDARGRETG